MIGHRYCGGTSRDGEDVGAVGGPGAAGATCAVGAVGTGGTVGVVGTVGAVETDPTDAGPFLVSSAYCFVVCWKSYTDVGGPEGKGGAYTFVALP